MKLPKALNEATAGAALKYHIKRALERSHSISDFSKNLELSATNAKFSNNTLKIIEELNNGVKQASDEIKEKARDFSNEKLTNEQIKELVKHPNAKAIGLPRLMLPIGKVWFSLCVPNHRDFTEFELQRIPYRSHTSYLQRRNFAYFLR